MENITKPKTNYLNLILISVAFVLFIVGVYYLGRLSVKPKESITPPIGVIPKTTSVPPESVDPISNWKIYTNTSSGYSVSYPLSWKVENYGLMDAKPADQTTKHVRFSYQPDITKTSIGFEIEESPVVNVSQDITFNEIRTFGKETLKCGTTSDGMNTFCWLKVIDQSKFLVFTLLNYKNSDDNKTITQILSTFKFTEKNKPSVLPTKQPVINKIKILDTSSWNSHTCGVISFKLPTNYSPKCHVNGEISTIVDIGPAFSISVNKYNGGSRRQYWIEKMNASADSVSKYIRFQESVFGTVSGLDVFTSGGWFQGGDGSPILIAKGNTIVSINGGRTFNDQTGEITRWDITDSIASTIIFNN